MGLSQLPETHICRAHEELVEGVDNMYEFYLYKMTFGSIEIQLTYFYGYS